MSTKVRVCGLYAILDHPHPRGLDVRDVVVAMLEGGARTIQLRAKGLQTVGRLEVLARIAPLCAQAGAALWVNDDLEAATSGISGVVGLHLGQRDLDVQPDDWRARLQDAGIQFGLSTHDRIQLASAPDRAPVYVGFGPVFATRTKRDAERVVGISGLRRACSTTTLPVVAIGGIDGVRVGPCFEAGAAAVAAIAALQGDTPRAIELATRAVVEECERSQRAS